MTSFLIRWNNNFIMTASFRPSGTSIQFFFSYVGSINPRINAKFENILFIIFHFVDYLNE